MTVFLGTNGRVRLRRNGSEQRFDSDVSSADVREDVNRFSVDFAHEQLITGDRITIRQPGGADLNWIDVTGVKDIFTRFIHVDEAGGIRLYDSFSDAIRGEKANAISLKKPTTTQSITIQVVNGDDERCLAEVTSYSITTNRETIDTTDLGSHYRKEYESGLINGQGQLECLFRQPGGVCDDLNTNNYEGEFSSYLARLCLRLVHGSAFHGFFYIYSDETNENRSVWYESDTCIVTNVALTVSPTELIRVTIDFVTSGPITLREGYIPAFLQLENTADNLLQESDYRIELENPD